MEGDFDYDVIVVGAGPAGLSVGSELSQGLKVLVLDQKATVSDTTKSWFIPKLVLEGGNSQETQAYMYGGVKRFITQTFGGADTAWDAHMDFLYVRENDILKFWADRIAASGSEIRLSCWYQDSEVTAKGVTVNTSQGNFTARLLVDASGSNSLIRTKYAISNRGYYWWSVFGAIVELPEGLGDMKVGDYMMWGTFRDTNVDPDASLKQGRPVLEYEILDDRSAFIFIFTLRPEKVQMDLLKEEFLHIVQHEQSTVAFRDAKVREWKHGWYPSGGPDSQEVTEDRVAFIGDAGCWTTPCGWGMSFILANYRPYAHRLLAKVKADDLHKRALRSLVNPNAKTKYQVLLDQVTTHFLSYASASLLDQFILLFRPDSPLGDKGGLLCEKLFTLTISDEEARFLLTKLVKVFDLKALMHVLPYSDYLLLLELVKEHIEVKVLDEVHGLLDLFRKGHAEPPFVSGFTFA